MPELDVGTLLPDGPGWAPVARDVLSVVGPDAATYLQGQLSQDVEALREGHSAWTLLLAPTGKLGWWLRVTRLDGERFLLDVDDGVGADVEARLQRFLLRTKAEVAPAEGWEAIAVRGTDRPEVEPRGASTLVWAPAPHPWIDPDVGVPGVDLLADGALALELGRLDICVLEALRIASGVPGLAELTDGRIPAEAGDWLVRASASFTKGCYTGQELVARIDSRGGNVPRRLRGLVVDHAEVPPAGAEVRVGGEVVGEVTSAAPSPAGPLALAYVKRTVEPPAQGEVVVGSDPVPVSVRALPLV